MKMSQTGGNLNEDEGIYANQNETVDEDIYTNPETIRAQTDGIDRKKQGGKLPGADATGVKYYRVAVVSLGLLCALLLVVIIWMGTKHTAERDQQQRNKDLLQLTNNNLTQEKDHCQARNTNLTAEKEMLQKASGWRCSDSSCYYISTSLKTWNDSKQHCMDLGGHLVIIDNEEEQKFISGFKKRLWIGAMETEGTWKWVDGKVLGNAEYWGEGEPNDYQGREEDCAEIFFLKVPLRNWNDVICNFNNIYTCEKAM